jgi:MFS family permease
MQGDGEVQLDMPSKSEDGEHKYGATAWFAVLFLSLLYFMGTLDRQIIYLLSEPIKKDLSLSDVEVSLIQGLAFGGLYILAMVPVGWLVDNYNRKYILSIGTLIWGVGAVLSGLSRNFMQLFGARSLVGGGEATILPSSYSLIADYFPVNRLALPMCIFTIGGTLGSGMTMLGGGLLIKWIEDWPPIALGAYGTLAPWQIAFIATGLPSFLFAILILGLRQPVRLQVKKASRSTKSHLWSHYRKYPRFYLCHTIGFSLINCLMVGLLAWVPAFLSRKHGWGTSEIGYWLGGGQLVVGLLGIAVHGFIVDRMFNRGYRDAHFRYFILAAIVSGLLAILAFQVSDARLAVILYVISFFCIIGFPGIGAACLQMATPPNLRGQASAFYLISIMVIGTVLGPLMVAMLTDHVFRSEAYLGYSMISFAAVIAALAAIVFASGLAAMRRLVSGDVIAVQ